MESSNNFNLTFNTKCNDLTSIIHRNQLILWTARFIVIFLIFYTFIGFIKVLEIILISIEQITHKGWNKTLAKFSIIAFGLNCFEILYPTFELLNNRFQSINQNGPNLIIVFIN